MNAGECKRCAYRPLYCRDEAMLTKYGLKPNDAILAEEKHMGLYEDLIQNHDAKLIAGGAAQNTARGAQVTLPLLSLLPSIPPSIPSQSHPLTTSPCSTSFPPPQSSTSAPSAPTTTPPSSVTPAPRPASAPNT